MAPEAELDRLYGVPQADFVSTRNQIAAQLKSDGDEDGARRVGALKKPSISAWAVNQLARSHQADISRLIKAGESIAVAQTGPRTAYEAARKDESDAIRQLHRAAKEILASPSAGILDRIINSLRAGAATEEGRDLLKQGRLTEDLVPPGFGAFSTQPVAAFKKASSVANQQAKTLAALDKRKHTAEASARALAKEAAELESKAREAEQLASRLAKAAAAASKKATEAAAQLEGVEAEIKELGAKRCRSNGARR